MDRHPALLSHCISTHLRRHLGHTSHNKSKEQHSNSTQWGSRPTTSSSHSATTTNIPTMNGERSIFPRSGSAGGTRQLLAGVTRHVLSWGHVISRRRHMAAPRDCCGSQPGGGGLRYRYTVGSGSSLAPVSPRGLCHDSD